MLGAAAHDAVEPWSTTLMITGINHITLAVGDANAAFAFYRDVLGLRPIARWPRGAYLLAGDIWLALVEDSQVRTAALPEYTHIAFSVAEAEFQSIVDRLEAAHARTWKENESEGASLYFEDPDGHKLELHVGSLATRLAECRANPWPGLELFE